MPVSFVRPIIGGYLPSASPIIGLRDGEQELITALSTKLSLQSSQMLTLQAYYDGTQRLADLGVSIPPQLAVVRTVVDWPRVVVDPLVQRAVVDGFRLPGQTDTDDEMWGFWQSNNLDTEFPLAVQDKLTLGRAYMIVGSADRRGDPPVITPESPFNCAVQWDPRTRSVTAAYQAYEAEGAYVGVLYLPNATVYMSRTQQASWTVDHRDEHNLGAVPVVRFPNRARTADREGRSEITPAVRNITDETCRTLLGMAIAREFYSVPHRYGLGLSEEDFRNPDGSAKQAIEMVMSNFIAFQRNERGDIPSVGQFQAFDPSVFTKIIESQAQLLSSFTGYPPSYFGINATANPASADAIRSAQDPLNRRAKAVNGESSDPLEQVMRLAWRIAHNGADLPSAMLRMETDWQPVEVSTPAATTDALFKQTQMGAVPPTSDVVLARLGYSAVERARLVQDRALDAAASELAELAQSLEAKEARTDKSVIEDLTAEGDPTPQAGPGQIVVPAHVRKKPTPPAS